MWLSGSAIFDFWFKLDCFVSGAFVFYLVSFAIRFPTLLSDVDAHLVHCLYSSLPLPFSVICITLLLNHPSTNCSTLKYKIPKRIKQKKRNQEPLLRMRKLHLWGNFYFNNYCFLFHNIDYDIFLYTHCKCTSYVLYIILTFTKINIESFTSGNRIWWSITF